jgi:hypothetical protein
LDNIWDITLPDKKFSFFFSKGSVLGMMLSQTQFQKNCQDSYRLFAINVKVKGHVEVRNLLYWRNSEQASCCINEFHCAKKSVDVKSSTIKRESANDFNVQPIFNLDLRDGLVSYENLRRLRSAVSSENKTFPNVLYSSDRVGCRSLQT